MILKNFADQDWIGFILSDQDWTWTEKFRSPLISDTTMLLKWQSVAVDCITLDYWGKHKKDGNLGH